jgi:hypothetical protein
VLAALGGPDVLLLDEPYQGLDRDSVARVGELLWSWRDEGRAALVASHAHDAIERDRRGGGARVVDVLTITEMTTRGLTRRRAAAALMVALPLAFYLVRHDLPGQSVRFLAIGLAWAASTLALFAALGARAGETRLVVAGWSRRDLVGGRVVALLGVAVAMAAAYWGIVAVDEQVGDLAGVALMLGVTASTSVALGTALGALARVSSKRRSRCSSSPACSSWPTRRAPWRTCCRSGPPATGKRARHGGGDSPLLPSPFTNALKNAGSRMAVAESSKVGDLPLAGSAARTYTTVTDATIASTFEPYIARGYDPDRVHDRRDELGGRVPRRALLPAGDARAGATPC